MASTVLLTVVIRAADLAQARLDLVTTFPSLDAPTAAKVITHGIVPAGSPAGTAPVGYWFAWRLTPAQVVQARVLFDKPGAALPRRVFVDTHRDTILATLPGGPYQAARAAPDPL